MCKIGPYIYRLKPGNSWNIGEYESWFSDMAERGFILCSIGIGFAKFKKSQPNKIKYRVEASSKYSPLTEEQKSIYADYGWTYVDSWTYLDTYRKFHIFSSPEEFNAPELHTDPAEQSYTLEDLNHLQRGITLTSICLALLFLGIFTSMWSKRNIGSLSELNNIFYLLLLTTLSMTYCIITFLGGVLSIGKLKRNLSEGKALNHHAPWKRKLWLSTLSLGLYSVILVFILYGLFYNGDYKPLPESAHSIPIVFLSEIEADDNFTRTILPYSRNQIENQYLSINNFFTPINYNGLETGKTLGKYHGKSGVPYNCTSTFQIYQLRFKSMVNNLFYETLKKHNASVIFKKLNNPDFDLLYVSKGANVKATGGFQILASRKRGIIYLSYNGDASLENILEVISSKLKLIE